MNSQSQNKAIDSRHLEKKGGYPAGRPIGSGPMPAKFPSRPTSPAAAKKPDDKRGN